MPSDSKTSNSIETRTRIYASGSDTFDDSSLLVAENQLGKLNDLLFPRRCVVCDSEICSDAPLLVCLDCQTKMSRGDEPACRRCGASKLVSHISNSRECPKCKDVKFHFDSAYSLGDYDAELRQVIIEMKHPGQEPLIIQMGRWLGRSFLPLFSELDIDCVVAMPSFWTRHFSRGANVSALLCEGLKFELNVNVQTRLLKQTRSTKKQGTLTRSQRLTNVKNAFQIRSGFDIEGLTMLIVDDVMSSGATINETSRVIKRAGAAEVHALVVARGMGSI